MRPVAKVVPLERDVLEVVLQELHTGYQGRTAATLNWGGGPATTGSGESGQDFLDRIVDHFWTAVRASSY